MIIFGIGKGKKRKPKQAENSGNFHKEDGKQGIFQEFEAEVPAPAIRLSR